MMRIDLGLLECVSAGAQTLQILAAAPALAGTGCPRCGAELVTETSVVNSLFFEVNVLGRSVSDAAKEVRRLYLREMCTECLGKELLKAKMNLKRNAHGR